MIVLHLPFDLEHPALRAGYESARRPAFQADKPTNDIDFVRLVRDSCEDDPATLAYHVGFLIGLFAVPYEEQQP
ncbi:hypothetical protein KSC_066150 [Ktedonobacter sp. SOSP1-52]|uniref:hypothetical protein n=1 Tax=Ktedonobacter sp. SOSP1-52 TaxID=2778366 RepID=UPI001915919C|nr:hypothetical protein [Ktedonobacter sp. SOSP1-52]GHO67723.1 hypothetical protein KSC_066150 [Ktedonobacter sp. SOSP1-52]